MDELETLTETNEHGAAMAAKMASLARVGIFVGFFLIGWTLYKRTRR